MKNLDQDRDFLDLLAAWHENKSLSPARKKALIARLENDQDLRTELAREIEMAGLTRVAQAGEPRWLELEEKLGVSQEESSSDFESAIMDVLPASSYSKQSSKIISFPRLAWLGLATGLAFFFFQIQEKDSPETGVAQVIRIESEEESTDQDRILKKGEEFTIEQG